ncbi:MAG: hypothetical protein ACYDGR_07320 [Candidatus Dormibacteria bacterium]
MLLTQLHVAAAWLVVVLAAVWLLASIARLAGITRVPDTVTQAPSLALTLSLVAAFIGIAILFTGHRPRMLLHVAYGVVVVLVAPLMRALALSRPGRGALYEMMGALLLLGVSLRLFATG